MSHPIKVKGTINPKRYWLLSLPLLCLLAGCQTLSKKQPSKVTPPPAVTMSPPVVASPTVARAEPPPAVAQGEVSTCQRELLALSKVNPRLYTHKKAAFDDLLAKASVYTGVRNDIGSQTKDTLDALYKYKTQKLCSDIEQSVRQSLINSGENIK